ncbi:breast cancer anti-estrogen resistance protein 1 isoform X2 [Trichomycterus rosablanca]|uniref:breast cancer anti-estrogen resistance protein 1 isoform X2 n=1 Tax=Trichomycterus rosablanca TaxID=2290929 RepID=UPI002F360C2C
MNYLNVLAKALYDNVAESPDELSFRKGDIMTVLERDTQGLDGWWLCSLHGRQGIVPGNRLKILVGMYDKQQQQQPLSPQPCTPQSHLSIPPSAYSKPLPSTQYTTMHPACTSPPNLYQVPTGPQTPQTQPKAPPLTQKQCTGKYHPITQEIYQVPPSMGTPGQEVYQVPPATEEQDVYQVPPSLNQKQEIYQTPPSMDKRCWDSSKTLGKVVVPTRVGQMYVFDTGKTEQDEYNIPRHLPPSQDIYDIPPPRGQYNQQVYDTPPMVMKGPTSRDVQEIYDTPPNVDKNQLLSQQMVYDFPPSVSKDVLDGLIREETYDVPPHFAKISPTANTANPELSIPEDVYDVPPPLAGKAQAEVQEIYDIPSSQHHGDVYDFPREHLPVTEESCDYVYDVPPQVVRDAASATTEELTVSFKRLSASSTGSIRSNHSNSSLDTVPVRDSSVPGGAVANASQATDRTLQAKLSKQVQKMDEAFQGLLKHNQALDILGWAPSALPVPAPNSGGDDLDRLVMCARAVPDDTKHLASFLHGNATLLFRRTNRQQQHATDALAQLTSNASTYQSGTPDRANIQSRPLPSPPKFTAEEETAERPYETTEEGWMEDYDYVHLQGKEEFEKNQRQLLEKGRHNKTQLEQQQLKQFERLEQEVSRPINNDISNWTPPLHCPPPSRSKLCAGDRQLLLFYSEQCEANITTLTNAIDAFYSSINNNQPPKIFVAHSKFVILSAHKLVFIGDTVSRQAKSPEVRSRVAQHSNVLCEKLKDIVVSTKTAALQYPSPGAARDMTERVRELSGCTQQFRMALNHLLSM